MGYPATPRTWVAGDVLTAAQLNAELRDALLGAFPLGPPDVAWTAYTPTLTQSATVTKTVTYAKYTRVGKTISVVVYLTVTGAGTAGSAVTVGLPVAAADANGVTASGYIYDASTSTVYNGTWSGAATNTVIFNSDQASPSAWGTSPNLALASGDQIRFHTTYEAA